MITTRSKGFQLLDNNIDALRIGIESLLNRPKDRSGKNFIKRKGKNYPKFEETENLDYNLLPLLLQIIRRVLIMVLG